MTDSQQDPKRPSAKQLRYIRDLANSRGETFIYPRTATQASEEIDRLKARRPTPRAERRRGDRDLRGELADRVGDSASVRRDEISGYGSSARWSGRDVG